MGFLDPGDDLPANGTEFVGGIDQVKEVRGDRQGQLLIGQGGAGVLFGRESGHQPLKLLNRGDAVLELPMPIVPVRIGNVTPKAASGREELF